MSSPLLKFLLLAVAVVSAAAAPAAAHDDVVIKVAEGAAGDGDDSDPGHDPRRTSVALTHEGERRTFAPFARAARRDAEDGLVGVRWHLYDIAKAAVLPLRGLPTGKDTPRHVAVWRGVTAYEIDGGRRAGVYLRDGDGTRRASRLR